jgi:hypothetical protein
MGPRLPGLQGLGGCRMKPQDGVTCSKEQSVTVTELEGAGRQIQQNFLCIHYESDYFTDRTRNPQCTIEQIRRGFSAPRSACVHTGQNLFGGRFTGFVI